MAPTPAAGRGAASPAPRSLLDALPEPGAAELLAVAVRRTYDDGELLVRQGDEGSSMYLIESGRVCARLESAAGAGVTLSLMGAGEVFGEMGVVMASHERTASIRALGPVTARVLRQEDVRLLREHHPAVSDFLVEVLARRVQRLSSRLLEAHHSSVDQRLARRLYEAGRLFAEGAPPVVLPLTQEDLAGLAGTTRPTANQVLKRWEADGVLRLERGRTTILDVAALRARCR